MRKSPQSIPNNISRSYPGRFVIEEIELKRLVSDIDGLLGVDTLDKRLQILYLVGLKNGVAYETSDLDVVLSEENAQGLRIVLLVIHAQVIDGEGKASRGILVHFHREKMNRASDWLEMSTGIQFNLNFEGLGYYVRDVNRQASLEIIEKLEERLKKFRRYYSNLPRLVSPYYPPAPLVFIISVIGVLLYLAVIFTGSLPPITISGEFIGTRFIFPESSTTLATTILAVLAGMAIIGIVSSLTVNAVQWLVPPSVIAIGDEIISYRRQSKLREAVFWTIVVGGLVGIVVNLITK